MARSMKALGVACVFGFSAVRGSPDDSAALVQTQVRSHVSGQGAMWTDLLKDIYAAATAEATAEQATGAAAPLEMAQKPEEAPIWHGMLFERQVVESEAGNSGYLTFDHGCAKRDEYGDNECEFPHGDTVHAKFEAKLAKPIESGYFSFTGTPKLMGIGGFLKNGIDGKKKNPVAKMQEVNVECPICGGTCDVTLLGKTRSIQLLDCPLPANQTITLFDMDMDLPFGQLLPLIQMRMQGSLVIYRQEGEETHLVSNSKMLFQMGRIYKGMPTMM